MPTPEAVNRLIAALAPGGPTQTHWNWVAIEASLGGIALPSDFKAFLDHVPAGRFAGELVPNYPGRAGSPADDFLAPVAHITDTFTRWREKGDGVFPHPLFPEPGGLLIWATGAERIYFWLTESADPDTWPVVCSNLAFTEWKTFPTGMAEFLLTEMDAGRLPPFKPYGVPGAAPARSESIRENEKPRWATLSAPANQADTLIAAIDPRDDWHRPHDWSSIEARLGTALPRDYKTFIDACGPGQLCDLNIATADECRSYDMFILQAKQTAAAARAGLTGHLSFHPAANGLLCWGTAPDGTYLNWKTTADNPDEWSVAFFRPGTVGFYDEFSFSTFLLRYAGLVPNVVPPVVAATGQPWSAGITFARHECPVGGTDS